MSSAAEMWERTNAAKIARIVRESKKLVAKWIDEIGKIADACGHRLDVKRSDYDSEALYAALDDMIELGYKINDLDTERNGGFISISWDLDE